MTTFRKVQGGIVVPYKWYFSPAEGEYHVVAEHLGGITECEKLILDVYEARVSDVVPPSSECCPECYDWHLKGNP